MKCPFCNKNLERDPSCSLDTGRYICSCRDNLQFSINWKDVSRMIAEWYTTFLGFRIRHSTSIDRKLFKE